MAVSGIINQGVGGIASIAGSYFSRKAAAAAQKAKEAALNALEEQNIAKTNETVQQYDKSSYLGRLGLLKEADPNTYGAYQGAGQIMSDITADQGDNRAKSQTAANAAYDETILGQQGLTDSEKLAADQSAELLTLKGSLSPEQQAEFVRAGFAQGGGVGGVAGSDAGRSGMARLLMSDQLKLQQAREAMAGNLQNQSQTIRANRNTMLNNIGLMQQEQQSNASNIAGAANTFAGTRLPSSYGLSGHDAGDLDVQNTNLRNQRRLALAGAQVEGINGRLAATNQMIGGVANTGAAVGRGVAAFYTGGMSEGGGGGMGGGGGGMV